MRIAWIIGGLALATVLGVAMLVEDEVPTPTAGEARATLGSTDSVPPGLRGATSAGADAGQSASQQGKAPSADRVLAWIRASLKLPADSEGWERLRVLLDDPAIDFAPHMDRILLACFGDTEAEREPGVRLLAIALDPDRPREQAERLAGLGNGMPPPPYASPLSAKHFDMALKIATGNGAPEAALAIFWNLPQLGPRAQELIPHAMRWLADEASSAGNFAKRLRPSVDGDTLYPDAAHMVARAIGQLGIVALDPIEPWVADVEGPGRSLATAVVAWIGRAAEAKVLAWLGAADPRLRRGALDLFDGSSLAGWSPAAVQSVRARLNDPVAKVRQAAAAALTGWLPRPEVSADLADVLRGHDVALRAVTLDAISQRELDWNRPSTDLQRAMLDILRHPEPEEYAAALAVGGALSREGVADVTSATPGLLRALAGAGLLDSGERIGAWPAAYNDARWWSELTPAAWPHLWAALQAKDARLREAAAWVMAWDGKPDSEHQRLLGAWLEEHPTSPLRSSLACALANAHPPQIAAILVAGLRATTWSERGIAAMGLERLGVEGVAHLGALAATLRDHQAHRLPESATPSRNDRPRPSGDNERAMQRTEAAFHALARRDLPAAFRWIDDESHEVRLQVHRAIASKGEVGMALLADRWPRASQSQRIGTLGALRMYHGGLARLRSGVHASLDSKDPAMRLLAAILIFADEGDESLVSRASDFLADVYVGGASSWRARAYIGADEAGYALARANQRSREPTALASLRRHLTHKDAAVRERVRNLMEEVALPVDP